MAIIDNFPVLTTPATGDELPIERGTTTYKIDYNALATAILNGLIVSRTSYTPNIYCSGNTGFAADNISFNYFKIGNILRVVGRFSISNIGDGTGGIRVSLPSNMAAIVMGVGSVGYYDAGNQVEHGFIRTVNSNASSTEVMLYYNAGGTATTPTRLGSGTYVSVDFTVYLG